MIKSKGMIEVYIHDGEGNFLDQITEKMLLDGHDEAFIINEESGDKAYVTLNSRSVKDLLLSVHTCDKAQIQFIAYNINLVRK